MIKNLSSKFTGLRSKQVQSTVSLVALMCLFLSASAFAKVESSYSYWGLGYANIDYPGSLERDLSELETHIGGISYDVALRYFSLPGSKRTYAGKHTVLGIISNGAVDGYGHEDAAMVVNHSLFSLSSMHFFGEEIGSGPFVRVDIGLSWLCVIAADSEETISEGSDFGFGYLLGGGFAFAKTLLNVNYSSRKIEGEKYRILSLSIGWLR